jgi:UDP-N-acetylmuramyl pentapeptide synthase
MENFLKKILASLARRTIAKYRPLVIGVTGSVGKTSTRHAIAAALTAKYRVREPQKNYNNEIGVPVTVLGAGNLEGSRLAWVGVIAKAVAQLAFKRHYPEVLVLEYGIDHPGDMDALLNIVQPKISVLTSVGISHNEFFKKPEDIGLEKGKIAEHLPAEGTFVFNADNEHVVAQVQRTKARPLSFGIDKPADVHLINSSEKLELPVQTSLRIKTPTRTLEATIPAVGKAHVDAVLAAIGVCEALEVETELVVSGLAAYKPVPSRSNVIDGIKHTILIDDTYNAAPDSVKEALALLYRFPGEIKYAVLGDMRELGSLSRAEHEKVGQMAASMKLTKLITIGEQGMVIAEAAKNAGMPSDRITSYLTSQEAQRPIQDMLLPDSVVLIKGSQFVRMERITKEIMAEPMRAPELVCRQYGHWLND